MVSINASCEVNAPVERVWEIVSDVDNDPQYWSGLNSIRNIRKEGNVIEREVEVGFRNSEGRQTITLNPKESVELAMTEGPTIGSRVIKLTPLSNGKKTRVDVSWNFEFSGVPGFVQTFVKRQITEGTKEALDRIAKAAQQQSSSSSPLGTEEARIQS